MFSIKTIKFLQALAQNNNRDWFNHHKDEYEQFVREPALDFIELFRPELKKLTPHFVAIPKKVGGSMMRPYRDTRFSKDKTPYKTNLGIQFRHELGKNVHAPGFYFHISPHDCFLGAGIWHPESKALRNIRELIEQAPSAWKKIKSNKALNSKFDFVGESLKNPPRGFNKESPNLEDLKRKDFMLVTKLSRKELYSKDIVSITAKRYKKTLPLMKFLCEAQELNF
ncbi:DUF2461 domain-containing protein [Kangiella sp. TOML190]|uniref:DUF2461 domain-containing protein n=1 Tax=Kangiella sp. TOML190 TaxID=2931351 RepID=UPI0020406DAA|nr:DUF2461 domain-containing protein [Kangiella sp. TOML190]